MTETAFSSQHPAVLAVWDFCLWTHERWQLRLTAEQERLGRRIYSRFSGLARQEEIVGLENLPDRDLPGWVKMPDREFLVPAEGAAGAMARRWLQVHQAPPSAERLLGLFGVAEYFTTAEQVYWPGVELLHDGLYVSWGTDTGWAGGSYFTRVKLSEFYAARECSVPAHAT